MDTQTKNVTIERENKNKATVPVNIFSEADQGYINAWSAASKPEESLCTNSKPKTTPTNLSEREVKIIGQKYVESCKSNGTAWGVHQFYHESIDALSQEVGDAYKKYYSTTKFHEIEKIKRVRHTEDYFLIELTIIHTDSHGDQYRTDVFQVRALLTAEGRIKYETIIQPHPVEELVFLLGTYADISSSKHSFPYISYTIGDADQIRNGRKLRFMLLLDECGAPPFRVETGPCPPSKLSGKARNEMREALKEVADWLLENGTSIDSSSPEVFIPEKAFSGLESYLKASKKCF